MQKIFIIDGYNVIHRVPELEAKLDESLENARIALATEVSAFMKRYPETKAHIVFDGSNEDMFDGPPAMICGIDCIFTRPGESADDRIMGMVRNAKDPSAITVISDDNLIRNAGRAHRAHVQYASFLKKDRKKTHRPARPSGKFDDTEKERELTDYYKKHLRGKGVI